MRLQQSLRTVFVFYCSFSKRFPTLFAMLSFRRSVRVLAAKRFSRVVASIREI